MKKINQTNLKRRISLMLLITIFLMSSLVVGCGKKNVNTVSTKEDALVEETEESEKIEQETEIVQTENEEKKNLGTFVLYFSGIDVWGWTDTKSRSDVNIIANNYVVRKMCYPIFCIPILKLMLFLRMLKHEYYFNGYSKIINKMIKERYSVEYVDRMGISTMIKMLKDVGVAQVF